MAIATTTEPVPLTNRAPEPARHIVTVDEFDRMAAAGVFGDARIELIDGVLIDVPPSDPPHAGNVTAFGHHERRTATSGDTVGFAAFPGVAFAVDELLGS